MRAGGASGVVGGRMGCCEPGPVYIPCSGAGRSRPASSHRIGRWLTRAPAAAPAPAAVASAAPFSAATSPISRPATMPQTQGTSAGHATSEAGFLPWTGRRARAGRTLSSSSNRSFVFATPETPGWKGGIGLPKALHAMWSPVSLFTTCVVPTTWFTQMTGCCRRPLFGDLRRWRDQRRSSWGWDGPSTGRGPRTSLPLKASNRSFAGGKTRDAASHKNTPKHTGDATKRSVFLMARRGRAQRLGMGDGRDRPCAACASLSLGSLS